MNLYQLGQGILDMEELGVQLEPDHPTTYLLPSRSKWFKIEYSLSQVSLTAHSREFDGVYGSRRPRGLVVACCNPIGVRAPRKHNI